MDDIEFIDKEKEDDIIIIEKEEYEDVIKSLINKNTILETTQEGLFIENIENIEN